MEQKLESVLKLEIVGLRKLFKSLREISEKKNMSLHAVRSILKEELGDEYEEYKYGTSTPKLGKHKVIEFWTQGNSLKKISSLTGFSIARIKVILAEKLEKRMINIQLDLLMRRSNN